MPVECRFDIEPLSRAQFYEVDHVVMGHAFDIQNEFGRFYDEHVYREALYHFLGGEDALMQSMEVVVEGRAVGHQKICRLDDKTCLHVSSTIRHFESYKNQLLKLLNHTPLKQVQWVNFNRKTIQLITLEK